MTPSRSLRRFLWPSAGLALLASAGATSAQNAPAAPPPIIDVHVHAGDGDDRLKPKCPNPSRYVASDSKEGPEAANGWSAEPCSPSLPPARKGEYMPAVLAEMERLNVTAVVLGDVASVKKWQQAAPKRIIAGTSFGRSPTDKGSDKAGDLKMLEAAFTSEGFKVMGEIAPQYAGLSPSDPRFDAFFALAERLDVPVAIHMGTGGSGRANVTSPAYRGSMGDPLLLEELLARHPRLRVQVMHAGYPMIDNMLTLLAANSHVYVDIAGLIWSYPVKEVNRYIQRLVDGGFEDRVMFGTDEIVWPGLMAHSIALIQNADYLTSGQKRDILYNNAARFLRLPRQDGR